MIRSKEGTFFDKDIETKWVEKGPLAGFATLTVIKVSKHVIERRKYNIPFIWMVKSSNGNVKASGYGRTYKVALMRAEKARAHILEHSVRQFSAPDSLSDKWENMVAE